jgi:hypothetical protein
VVPEAGTNTSVALANALPSQYVPSLTRRIDSSTAARPAPASTATVPQKPGVAQPASHVERR